MLVYLNEGAQWRTHFPPIPALCATAQCVCARTWIAATTSRISLQAAAERCWLRFHHLLGMQWSRNWWRHLQPFQWFLLSLRMLHHVPWTYICSITDLYSYLFAHGMFPCHMVYGPKVPSKAFLARLPRQKAGIEITTYGWTGPRMRERERDR